MDAETLRAFEAFRDRDHQPFAALCYAPFVQLSFEPNGNVSVCVESRSHPLGNLREQRLDELWQCARARRLQEALRRDAFPRACETCRWRLEARRFRRHAIRSFDPIPVDADGRWPGRLEFALGNTCNLACIMCNPDLSSVLRARAQLPPLPRVYGDRFFEELAPYLAHAHELAFLGGEPFLLPECFRIWEMLIERRLAPVCHVTTNGTIWNPRIERVLAELPFNLSISIDGTTPETFERIRQNARWDDVMANLERFEAYVHGSGDRHAERRSRKLQLNYCLMPQNWEELGDFFQRAEDRGADVVVDLVVGPRHCSLLALPLPELRPLVAALEARGASLLPRLSGQNEEEWIDLIDELREYLRAEEASHPRAATSATAETGPRAAVEAEPVPAEEREPPAFEHRPGAACTADDRRQANAADGSVQRAWFCMAIGDEHAALEAASATPVEDPRYYDALVVIASIWSHRSDGGHADAALQRALDLAPGRPEAWITRAWLRYRQDRVPEGLRDLARAEGALDPLDRLNPMLTDAVLVTGAILLQRRGEERDALARLERYHELEPDPDDRRRSLARMRAYLGPLADDPHAQAVFRVAGAGLSPGAPPG